MKAQSDKSIQSESRKVFIKTHGCQMNEYDSAKMFDLLQEKENFEISIKAVKDLFSAAAKIDLTIF
mgnify:CR=1 FL=1